MISIGGISVSLILIFFIYLDTSSIGAVEHSQSEAVGQWSNTISNDLKRLGNTITKKDEIRWMYTFSNVQVKKKDPEGLLTEVVNTVATMMKSKINAVRRVVETAEREAANFDKNQTAEHYEYYSALYSPDEDNGTRAMEPTTLMEELEGYLDTFKPMKLNADTHFYNLSVNTSYSAVYVPYNVFDLEKNASYTIQWSEALDKIFRENYSRDPALSWQYFGAANGILRLYPAKQWEEHVSKGFDCRTRTWFIEAATCTKDVVILIDTSGSMSGMRKQIALATAYSILDTFSNNDFVNVMNYSLGTNYTVECFKNDMAQATRENVALFKKKIAEFDPKNKTNLEQALESAFNLLYEVRKKRDCLDSSSKCNQAIMLITDEVAVDVTEVILKYNRQNNDTETPVRMFTYMVGREIPDLENMYKIACNNRGYHSNVRSLEEITSSVLQYINVIARPLVLNGSHPASWTHAYMDTTVDEKTGKYRLLTSVAIPAFDRKANINNETRKADLLGVAGTDIPIDDIGRLTYPYKIGANGYSFIVSNNGYVLKHPNLQPMVTEIGQLKENYNSIDLMDVELFDDNLGPRELNPDLVKLRNEMVNRQTGSMHNISIKYHYDGMRRVSKEVYDYYYAPIRNSPFTLGIALPKDYGLYSIQVKDLISRNEFTGKKLTDYFEGENWKIHPDWVYCKYHYLEGHEYATPELEILDFLGKMYERKGLKGFQWEKQYKESQADADDENDETHELEDYYCDRELVERLVFDAKNTMEAFPGKYVFNAGEKPIIEKYNVSLRFVATMSGLTRWEYIFMDTEEAAKTEFGDYHFKAIDETWYKTAVLEHRHNPEGFVFSVPFRIRTSSYDIIDDGPTTVTASHAIFLSDSGDEAPGAVVGYQFMYDNLKEVFFNVTGQVSHSCQGCLSCKENEMNCYIVDRDGYIIVNADDDATGRFFGYIEGDIMESLVEIGYFDAVRIYDYQAYCEEQDDESSKGSIPDTMFDFMGSTFQWLIAKITWLMLQIFSYDLYNTWSFAYAQGEWDYDSNMDDFTFYTPIFSPCEREATLYILNQNMLPDDFHSKSIEARDRNYYIASIKYTNLVLIAINNTRPVPETKWFRMSNQPKPIVYDNNFTELPCQKRELNDLARSRLQGCFNDHELEKEIKECGRPSSSTKLHGFTYLIYLSIFLCVSRVCKYQIM